MSSSNYDKARALANLKMEQAKSLSFASAEGQLPGVAQALPTPLRPL